MTRGENQNPEEKTLKKVLIIFAGLLVSGLAGFILFSPLTFQSDDFWLLYFAQKYPNTFFSDWLNSNGPMYRPVTILFLFAQIKLFGYQPVFFYLVNLLLHLFNTFIVWKIMLRLPGDKFVIQSRTAIIIALIYFFLRFQSITNVLWISAITDILSFAFGISGLYILVQRKESFYPKIFAGICFLLSLLAKETGIVFIYFAFLYELITRTDWKIISRNTLLLITVVIWYSMMRYIALGSNFFDPGSDGLLIFKEGYWKNMIPALFVPFDVNDINSIRWGDNIWSYLFLFPVVSLLIFLPLSFRELYRGGRLLSAAALILISFFSMFLYSTYPPSSRLAYINGLPLVFVVALMSDVLKRLQLRFFLISLFTVLMLGNMSEIWYHSRQDEFHTEFKEVINNFDVKNEPLIVLPYHFTSHQRYMHVPLSFTSEYWATGSIDTVRGTYIMPFRNMGNSFSDASYRYTVKVLDTLTLELDTQSLLAKYIYNPSLGSGDGSADLYRELIDTAFILDKGQVVSKGREARIQFKYEGIINHNPSILFVRDRDMRIEKLTKVLGLSIP